LSLATVYLPGVIPGNGDLGRPTEPVPGWSSDARDDPVIPIQAAAIEVPGRLGIDTLHGKTRRLAIAWHGWIPKKSIESRRDRQQPTPRDHNRKRTLIFNSQLENPDCGNAT
jgi:hypothetical protein